MKKSYTEIAGKTALLLYAQDGRHSAPCLRILGHSIVLTFFDRGGSLSTSAIDINQQPEEFLCILVGLSCAHPDHLGFNETIIWEKDGRKRILIAWHGDPTEAGEVVLDKIIFISDALHGCGTTVWAGWLYPPSSQPQQEPRQIVVKDSWINPLRKYTEGNILARLNEAGIKGVPEFEVLTPHIPISKSINQPTFSGLYYLISAYPVITFAYCLAYLRSHSESDLWTSPHSPSY